MAFALGSFAGGVGGGLEQGQRIRQKQMELQQLSQAQQALKLRAQQSMAELQQLGAGPGGAPSQPPGGPSAGGGGPQPMAAPGVPPGGPPPLGGPSPVPSPGAQLATLSGPAAPGASMNPGQAMDVLSNPSATQMPSGGSPPAAAPAPPPQAAPAPAPAPQPGGGAQPSGGDPSGIDIQALGQQWKALEQQGHQELLQRLKSIVDTAKASGKKVDPVTAMKAAEDSIKADDNLPPDLKALISAEVQMQRLKTQFVLGQGKLAQGEERIVQGDKAEADRNARQAEVLASQEKRTKETIAGANQRNAVTAATARRGQDMNFERGMASIAAANSRAGASGGPGGGVDSGSMASVKLEKALEGTAVGKDYATKTTAYQTLRALHDMPDIDNNGPAQIQLINRALFMSTGSVRPPLAEIKTLIGDKNAQDYMDTIDGKISAAPILGRDQIEKLFSGATAEVQASRAGAHADPVAGPVLRRLEGGGAAPAPSGKGKSGGVKRFRYDAQGNLLPQ